MNTLQSSVLLRESVRAVLALFEPLTRVDSKTAHLSRSVTTFCGYGSPGPPPLDEREFIYLSHSPIGNFGGRESGVTHTEEEFIN